MEQNVTWKSPGKIVFFLASLILLSGLLVAANLVDPAVHFADPNLEKAIREKIDQPTAPLSRLDLLAITELDASGRDIKRLDGIEALRRLVVLNLADNVVENLSSLANLSMLSELNLQNNQITDLESINFDQITHLPIRSLNLRHNVDENQNRLSNISLLSELSQIEVLDLRENHIDDIGYLASLTNLRKLDLRENYISDIEPLRGLQSLENLNLRENNISDIDPLRRIHALQELNIRENRVEDIEPLAGLTNLTYLNIHSNPVKTGLDALSNLGELQTLIMRNVFIGGDFQFLGSLTNLQRLNIRNSAIADVSVIGDLMRVGALQDDLERGISASIDLLEINPIGDGGDPYLSLRRYWDHISSHYPIDLPYHPSLIKSPVFSHQSGYYEKGFYLTLSTEESNGTMIFYTLNGDEPSLSPQLEIMGSTQEYAAPILIESRVGEPNQISNLETSKIMPSMPLGEVFKASVVRAIAVDNYGNRSNVLTQTYFVDEHIKTRYTFPLISIVTNVANLFDDEIGIYTLGKLYQEIDENPTLNPANFQQRGLRWERPISFQMFSSNGEVLIAQNVGVRVHGSGGRVLNAKSLRIHARDVYDEYGFIQYDFFSQLNDRQQDSIAEKHETLILRSGNHDLRRSLFRDQLAQSLLQHTNLDIQGYMPVILFINGEYWGIYNIQKRYDENYFQTHYGIASDDLLVLENGWDHVRVGDPGDLTYYSSLFSLIDENYLGNNYLTISTLSNDKIYQEIASRVDINNFISYYVSEVYFNNTDWPKNNVLMWTKKINPSVFISDVPYGQDGKWRWMITDIDFGFRYPDNNALTRLTLDFKNESSTYLFRSFLENREFRHLFINQFADHLNTTFRENVVVSKVDDFEKLYYPEIEEFIYRWGKFEEQTHWSATLGGSFDTWLQNVEEIRNFARLRPTYQRQHLLEYFDLPGIATVNLQTDSSRGYIRINSINIQKSAIGVDDPANWSGIYFQGVPVEIAAVPAPGYRFVGWKETGSKEAELILMLTEDVTLTAEFEKAE